MRINQTKSIFLQKAKSVVSSPVDKEMVLMSIDNGEYYGLNEIATRAWELLPDDGFMDIQELIAILLEEYKVEETECKEDLIVLFEQMAQKHLVQIKQGDD